MWSSLCSSDKSKRRTKTVKKSAEPKWNQTFLYSHVHRRDFRERMLEITVWDQPRIQEEESEFLGEVNHDHLYIIICLKYCIVQIIDNITVHILLVMLLFFSY